MKTKGLSHIMKAKYLSVIYFFLLLLFSSALALAQEVVIHPKEYQGALRNPLMGFATGLWAGNERYDWGTLAKVRIKWNEIENAETDGIDKIRDYCNAQWKDIPALNVKVIPRVYLQWSTDKEKYWPADLLKDDYSSDKFKRRLTRLIARLGQVWDNDPRVAFVEMGLIGKWGEHHTPAISPELQKLMGDAFAAAFKHKLVMVRHSWDFRDYRFGIYWDSFAHIEQDYHAQGMLKLGDRWQQAVIGGETAYDWGRFKEQPGDNPDDTLSDSVHRKYLINLIRQLHCNHLGWVADYDRKNATARAGAEEVQKVFGYRFVLEEVRYPARVENGAPFEVAFKVQNTGSTPFYYSWPMQLLLLDASTRKPVWKANFSDLDIRRWLPGDFWLSPSQNYALPPATNQVRAKFTVPNDVPKGNYILALAICDPAGALPSARFSTIHYFNGGYHPVGYISLGTAPKRAEIDPANFDEIGEDRTLHYIVPSLP